MTLLTNRFLFAAVALLLVGGTAALALNAVPTSSILPEPEPAAPRQEVVESGTFMVWTARGLTQGFPEQARELPGVAGVTVVSGDVAELVASWQDGVRVDEPTPGFVVPLDALAIHPEPYASLVPGADLDDLRELSAGEALLGETSAALRGLGPGAILEFATGARVTVRAVVPDEAVGFAEIVVPLDGAHRLGVTTPRSMVVRYEGDPGYIEGALRRSADDGTGVRIRRPDEIDYFRHGGTVVPQVLLKERFGEFGYRQSGPGRVFEQEPRWIDAHLAAARLPVVGEVVCHREILPIVANALEEVVARGLEHTIDPGQYAGCWGPRLIAPGQGLSRHAWGIAIDFNAVDNAMGLRSSQDPRLVEIMTRRGFIWGGEWLIPDGMHFEMGVD